MPVRVVQGPVLLSYTWGRHTGTLKYKECCLIKMSLDKNISLKNVISCKTKFEQYFS